MSYDPTYKQLNRETILLCIYFHCLSVYLYLIKVKTAEPIGPKFCVHDLREGSWMLRITKKVSPKAFDFLIFKNRQKNV